MARHCAHMSGVRGWRAARGQIKLSRFRKIVEGGTMPVINADGCPIYVEVEGPERAPVLMLSNSLGNTLNMWDHQVAPFTQHFRLVL
jgi:hypothetical protein